MVSTTKRKTSLTLDAQALDCAKELDINVSAVAEAALKDAVASARQAHWLKQNAEAFAAQAAWHERHGHPLADIISAPGGCFVERLTRPGGGRDSPVDGLPCRERSATT
jgi:antitoxin CcdA